MSTESQRTRLLEALMAGDRPNARAIVDQQRAAGLSPEDVITDLLWPTYATLEQLHRDDQVTTLTYQLAGRLLRVLVDRVADGLRLDGSGPGAQRTILALCGPSDTDELGAQMAVDLLEHYGFSVAFGGGRVPADEVQAHVQTKTPDILLMFCSSPADLPQIRGLIDTLHEVGACPSTQIVVGGGVFNRAPGLAEEIGADLWAEDPLELVEIVIDGSTHRSARRAKVAGKPAAKAKSEKPTLRKAA